MGHIKREARAQGRRTDETVSRAHAEHRWDRCPLVRVISSAFGHLRNLANDIGVRAIHGVCRFEFIGELSLVF